MMFNLLFRIIVLVLLCRAWQRKKGVVRLSCRLFNRDTFNRLATSFKDRRCRRRSLTATIYISTVVFWYNTNRIPSIGDNNKHRERVTPLPIHKNRISVSLHKTAAADSGYYTRFSTPKPYMCGDKQSNPLPSTVQKYFNFVASVETDLKIMFIGDSVGAQFAQAFDSAVLDEGQEDSARATKLYGFNSNQDLFHLCMSISAPIRGGGVSAFWRVTNLILRETNAWPSPSKCKQFWRNWNEGQALAFLNHEYNSTEFALPSSVEYKQTSSVAAEFWQKTKLASFKTGNVVNRFDAVVLRPQHGWLEFDHMKNATRIIESIETTHRILGATTIIIPTLPLYNNVQTENDWKSVAEINRIIREVARNITESEDGDVEYVLVQEFGNLTNQVLTENSKNLNLFSHLRDIDYSQQDWEVDLADVFLQRLPKKKSAKDWPPSHSQVCSNFPSNATNTCPGVKISPDGMHWCVETFGARFTASIACLLGCVYNVFEPPTHEGVRECEERCNEEFMSLSVVSDEMFKN